MKSNIKNVSAFLAVTIWADGEYAIEEKELMSNIAGTLNVLTPELMVAIASELKVLEKLDEDATQEYLVKNASAIDEEDAKVLMQCAIEIVLADDVVTREEVETLFSLADATGSIEHEEVTLMLLDLVKYCPEMEIQF